MTEVLAMPAGMSSEVGQAEEAETNGNIKTKLITAASVGALSLAAWYAESRGFANGLPPPAHSLRHPALGYYGAWAASRIAARHKASAAVAGGTAADFIGESAQDLINRTDHNPLNWLDLHQGERGGGNLDNLVDLACCLGGSVLFIVQNNNSSGWLRARASGVRDKLSGTQASPAPMPID